MNRLAKSLLVGLLEQENYITAFYGGGFKPPTKGHFAVIKKSLEQFPDIDKFYVVVGSGIRDGISQDESYSIWNIYKKYLGDKVEIIKADSSPLKYIKDYIKTNTDHKSYIFIGSRDDNDEDAQDFVKRKSFFENYDDHVEVKNILTKGGVSGTKAREAAEISKEQFFQFLPNEITDEERELIFDYVQTIIQENVFKNIASRGKELSKNFIKAFKDQKGDFKGFKPLVIKYLNKQELTPEEKEKLKRNFTDILKLSGVAITFPVLGATGNTLLGWLTDKLTKGKFTTLPSKFKDNVLEEEDPKVGTGKKPKGSGRRLYTDENPKDTVSIKFSTRQDIIDTLNKKSFKSKSHARQSQIINLIHQRVRAAYGRAKDPAVKKRLKTALDYAEERKEASKKKTQQLKKQKTNEAIDTNFNKVRFYYDYYTNVSPSTFEITLEENDIRISNIIEPYPSNFNLEDIRQTPINQNLEENIDPKSQSKHKGKSSPFGSAYTKVEETGLETAKKNMNDYKKSNNPSSKKPKDPFGLNQFAREIMKEEESFDTFDYPKHIKDLTKFMLDQGLNLNPLPSVKFINDDVENASNHLKGKTAYYDPNHNRIVLYTLNRHPKDVMRSFAHEMIHHMQNCEDRLGNINTQDIDEDDHLKNLESEAYQKGNLAFRSYTGTLTEGLLAEGRYDRLTTQISGDILKYWKNNLGKDSVTFENSYEHEGELIDIEATLTLTPNIGVLKVDGGADEETDFIVVNFEIDPNLLPQFWEEISFNLKDVIRHEVEHLTHGEGFLSKPGKYLENDELIRQMIDSELLSKAEYFKLEKEIDANLQGMYFRAKKERRPLKDVINVYLDAQDITPQEKQEILKLWGKRAKELNLPNILQENLDPSKIKIYLDMDGVLADFDQRFQYLSGMTPSEFEAEHGKQEFWDFIDEEHKVAFWVGIPVMNGAAQLVKYASKYPYEILTAPSAKKQSLLGKSLWVKKHMDLFGKKPKVNFKKAKNKHLVKPNLTKYDILVDDRADTINRWNEAGGTGILYTSASQVINDMKKIGL